MFITAVDGYRLQFLVGELSSDASKFGWNSPAFFSNRVSWGLLCLCEDRCNQRTQRGGAQVGKALIVARCIAPDENGYTSVLKLRRNGVRARKNLGRRCFKYAGRARELIERQSNLAVLGPRPCGLADAKQIGKLLLIEVSGLTKLSHQARYKLRIHGDVLN